MASKVVPQRIQNSIKNDISDVLVSGYISSTRIVEVNGDGTVVVTDMDYEGNILDTYEVIMVVIPRQAIHHSEVRNG